MICLWRKLKERRDECEIGMIVVIGIGVMLLVYTAYKVIIFNMMQWLHIR